MYMCISIYLYIYIYIIILMRKNFMFVCSSQAIWQSAAPCLEHCDDISCSLLVDPSCTDDSSEERNTCLHICVCVCVCVCVHV